MNNKVYLKNNLILSEWRYNLSDTQEKNYIKKFQKEYSEYNKEEYKKALTKWIDFCKYFLSKYPKTQKAFNYDFKDSDEYDSIDKFYLDVDIKSYKLDLSTKINKSVLNLTLIKMP